LASRALALRRSAGAFDAIRGHLTTGEDHGYEEMVSSLSYLAARGTDEERKALATILKPHFTQTNRMLESLFLSTVAADLRELRPDIERIATGSAEDVEGDKINRSGGRVTPVAERYHLARKILAVWDEPDAFTRAKLIVAFAFALEPWQLEGAPERADRVRSNLEDTLSRMSGPQRAELRVFVADAAKTRTETVGSDPSPASRLRELVRSAVGAEP
ncbi:MAG: hypothetical protein JNK60_10080, partial [Acidobacteria bacterium]|nr:hypothetical protein [Acidobacteriota bacterium]